MYAAAPSSAPQAAGRRRGEGVRGGSTPVSPAAWRKSTAEEHACALPAGQHNSSSMHAASSSAADTHHSPQQQHQWRQHPALTARGGSHVGHAQCGRVRRQRSSASAGRGACRQPRHTRAQGSRPSGCCARRRLCGRRKASVVDGADQALQGEGPQQADGCDGELVWGWEASCSRLRLIDVHWNNQRHPPAHATTTTVHTTQHRQPPTPTHVERVDADL